MSKIYDLLNRIIKKLVQPDWNQNDETQPDFVRGRTHYEEVTQKIVEVDFTTIVEDSGGRETYIDPADVQFMLDNAESLVFTMGSKVYYHNSSLSNGNCIRFSEPSSNKYSFSIILDPDAGRIHVYYENGGGPGGVLSVNASSKTIHQLDEKYIPDTIARTADIPAPTMIVAITQNNDGTYSADKTVEEISEAHAKGISVQALFNGVALLPMVACFPGQYAFASDTFEPGMLFWVDIDLDGSVSAGIESITNALSIFKGAGSDTEGGRGIVPAPAAGDNTKFLRGDGTWADAMIVNSSTEGSTKKFKLTVDDSGTITATEV